MIESVLSSLFTLENLLWINVGLAGGIMVGALPGLTGTMAMALLLPLTYGLASIPGVMLLLGVYCGSIYGGSITAILINTPGTPASAATSLDGYPMAQKGHGLRALHDALSASTIGGLFSCEVLLFAAPPIASCALKFGPAEIFILALLGICIIVTSSEKNMAKGLLAGVIEVLQPVQHVADQRPARVQRRRQRQVDAGGLVHERAKLLELGLGDADLGHSTPPGRPPQCSAAPASAPMPASSSIENTRPTSSRITKRPSRRAMPAMRARCC